MNVLWYLPWQTKRSWKLTVTCYVSRRCQVNGHFSFLFVFPILLCTFSVLLEIILLCNIISSSDQMKSSKLVSSQLPGRRMRCRVDQIRRRGAVSFVSQQRGLSLSRTLCLALHAHHRFSFLHFSFLHSVSCSNLLFRRENKFLCSIIVLFLGSESTRFV